MPPTRPILFVALPVLLAAAYFHLRPEPPFEPINPGDSVVVTGSSSGIGKHAVLSLAREGFTVFAGVRRDEDGEALVASADKFGLDVAKIKPIILDVTKTDHIANAVETVSEFVGKRGLKGLVNNAGIGSGRDPSSKMKSMSIEFMPMDEYRRVYDVNIFGLIETTKSFLPMLRKGKGRIVNVSSVAGFLASPFFSAYTSSKHAVEGFSDSLRRELLGAEQDVKVSVLEPGFVASSIFVKAQQKLEGLLPVGMEPYSDAERANMMQFWSMSFGAPSPRVTSEAIIHAIRSQKPKLRYIVGKDGTMLRVMQKLPASWIDSMGCPMPDKFDEDEIMELAKEYATEEFSL